MKIETKICKNCSQKFEITDADQRFYERVKVPAPLYCPPCRMQRRLAHRNERTLYRRVCDLCKKDSVSIYLAKTPWPVYCAPCWWGDGWNAKDYAMAYDPSRPFLDQFKELQSKVPRIALLSITSVNSEYTNNSGDNKNCYLIFAAENNEDCYYGRLVQKNKSVVDTAFIYDSELCYACVDCRACYNCLFSERCQTSSDLLFCFDVRDSNHCIFSTNLRHKSYCIENQQYSKEEYEKKKKEILASYESIEAAKKRFQELRSKTLVKYAFTTKCVDATGDYLFNCHEARLLFDASNAKACAYMADVEDPIDCRDGNNMYYKPELCVDMMGVLQCYACRYSTYVLYSSSTEYSDSSQNIESCFGCIGLRKTKYAVLNKEYSKEDYEALREKIVTAMTQDGSYGSFLPPELSPFGYNETLANDFRPLSKEEAIKNGFRWQDGISSGTRGKETIKKETVPNTIEEVKDDFTKEILVCEVCEHNFRITPGELQFYRKMHLPIPHKDFECRLRELLSARTPRQLWKGECQCDGLTVNDKRLTINGRYKNTAQHAHGDSACPNKFQTAYSPERKEVVYCEACYNAEVV